MDTLYSIETSTNDKIKSLRKEGLAQQSHNQDSGDGRRRRGILAQLFSWITGMKRTGAGSYSGEAKETGRIERLHQA